MAVYEGARPRPGIDLEGALRRGLCGIGGFRRAGDGRAGRTAEPGRGARTRSGTRVVHGTKRTSRTIRRVRTRSRSVGIVLAGIVIAFSGAFLSLSQTVRVAATGYDIVRLDSEHERLAALRANVASDVARLGSEPAVRKGALDLGLGQLGAPLVIPAR